MPKSADYVPKYGNTSNPGKLSSLLTAKTSFSASGRRDREDPAALWSVAALGAGAPPAGDGLVRDANCN